VHPRAGKPASRIVITAIKGSRAPLELKPGLVLQDGEGRYLPAVEAILRHGEPLAV
jgi:tRNA1(Val) A37 N6-methylase TrmN6